MQGNQTTNTVQLDVTTDHISILLRMVEHTKHAMIVEHVRDITMPIKVQLIIVLKYYNNLNKRESHHKTQFHQLIHPPHNLLIHYYHPHQFCHPNKSIHSLALLSPKRIMTTYSGSVKNGMSYNLKVVMDVNRNGLTLMLNKQKLETISAKTVEKGHHCSIGTTMCIQGQADLTSPHPPRWRKCSSHLCMH